MERIRSKYLELGLERQSIVAEFRPSSEIKWPSYSSTSYIERELRASILELESKGCLLKDVIQGLVDFRAMRLGEEVLICWKLDEPRAMFWHGVSEGFAGRLPIIPDEFISSEPEPD